MNKLVFLVPLVLITILAISAWVLHRVWRGL